MHIKHVCSGSLCSGNMNNESESQHFDAGILITVFPSQISISMALTSLLTALVHFKGHCRNLHHDLRLGLRWVPAKRGLCLASAHEPPAHCSSSSAGWVHSLGPGLAPGRGAQPHAASWRWSPPAPPGSAPPYAAAQRTPASSPPVPSEHWTAGEEKWRCAHVEEKVRLSTSKAQL